VREFAKGDARAKDDHGKRRELRGGEASTRVFPADPS
jgi:hypothetical protein